jgi:hypothetical protein
MPGAKKPINGKAGTKNTAGKKSAGAKKKRKPKAIVGYDPFDKITFTFTPHRLPGKGGTIDRKKLRAAIIKVRNERLAREKAEAELQAGSTSG